MSARRQKCLWIVVSSRKGLKVFERGAEDSGLRLIREELISRIGNRICHEPLIVLLDAWKDRYSGIVLAADTSWMRTVEHCLGPRGDRLIGRIEEELFDASEAEIQDRLDQALGATGSIRAHG